MEEDRRKLYKCASWAVGSLAAGSLAAGSLAAGAQRIQRA